MKKLIAAAVFMSVASLAQASEVYQCQAATPRGEARLTVNYVQGRPSRVAFEFYNESLNRNYAGNLRVKWFSEDTGELNASGALLGADSDIEASLSGSIEPSPSTRLYYFSVGSSAIKNGRRVHAREIELGYGNPLTCRRVR